MSLVCQVPGCGATTSKMMTIAPVTYAQAAAFAPGREADERDGEDEEDGVWHVLPLGPPANRR